MSLNGTAPDCAVAILASIGADGGGAGMAAGVATTGGSAGVTTTGFWRGGDAIASEA